MDINEIIWFEAIVEKLEQKHKIIPKELIEVLNNDPVIRYVEKGHRDNENLYSALGTSAAGRYIIIFFIYKHEKSIIIISARDMTKSERKRYEKHK